MIYVLHGKNQLASRNRLGQLKESFEKGGFSIILLDGKSATLEQINLEVSTNALLGEERAVVVDGFFANKKTLKNLISNLISGNVVFWESRELPKMLLGGLPKNWKVENFPIPQLAFKFLDMLMPGKPQSALRILHTLEEDDAFSLLPLLGWHVRYLIWAGSEPDTLNLPSWRKQKLVFQAAKFNLENLYNLHEQLLNLDRNIKTGTNVLPPLASLELLIANL